MRLRTSPLQGCERETSLQRALSWRCHGASFAGASTAQRALQGGRSACPCAAGLCTGRSMLLSACGMQLSCMNEARMFVLST